MSTRILRLVEGQHCIQDDMESIFYVVIYSAMRWLRHTCELPGTLSDIMRGFFDYEGIQFHPDRKAKGGLPKMGNLMDASFTSEFCFNSPLDDWIEHVRSINRAVLPIVCHLALTDDDKEKLKLWQPEILGAYWTTFLNETSLPTHDRVLRIIPNSPVDLQKAHHPATRTGTSNMGKLTSNLENLAIQSGPVPHGPFKSTSKHGTNAFSLLSSVADTSAVPTVSSAPSIGTQQFTKGQSKPQQSAPPVRPPTRSSTRAPTRTGHRTPSAQEPVRDGAPKTGTGRPRTRSTTQRAETAPAAAGVGAGAVKGTAASKAKGPGAGTSRQGQVIIWRP